VLIASKAIIQGSSRLVLGRQKPSDGQESTDGVEIDVETGDVVVVPAGVSHRSLDGSSKGGYKYIGVYPEVSSSSLFVLPGGSRSCRLLPSPRSQVSHYFVAFPQNHLSLYAALQRMIVTLFRLHLNGAIYIAKAKSRLRS
jgi:hypothetical protein